LIRRDLVRATYRPTAEAMARRESEGRPLTLRLVHVLGDGRILAVFSSGSPTPFLALDELLVSTRLTREDLEPVSNDRS
jgi:hypothetical protein